VDVTFVSAVVVLLLVTDPIGNIPIFAAVLRKVEPQRRPRIIVRESLIAYGVLVVFAFWGQAILSVLGISDRSLSIAGGVILFLIAIRLVFPTTESLYGGPAPEGEPFIVPLAIPYIAGPAAMASVIVLVSRAPERMVEWIVAITVAVTATALTLLFSERLSRLLGERVLMGLERLMGLVLSAIAIEMLLRGIETFIKALP
jgi:MarC family membrane protein